MFHFSLPECHISFSVQKDVRCFRELCLTIVVPSRTELNARSALFEDEAQLEYKIPAEKGDTETKLLCQLWENNSSEKSDSKKHPENFSPYSYN